MLHLFNFTYQLLWAVTQPFLRLSHRLQEGWNERTLKDSRNFQPSFDIWIQAASGGEAILANMVIEQLPHFYKKPLRILATSTTTAGIKTLQERFAKQKNDDLIVRYFPLDNPTIIKRAFEEFSPKLTILVETELWPAFLIAAHTKNIPVLVINGRMSEKSYKAYRKMHLIFRYFAPDYVLAMSEKDGKRYADLIGDNKVEIVPNIKFDRVQFVERTQRKHSLKGTLLPQKCHFIVFGSIRKEEEKSICACIKKLFTKKDSELPIIVAVFPKHLQRAESFYSLCKRQKIPCQLKSSLQENALQQATEDSAIVWDSFGELAETYSHADAAFVGGSLGTWGGHNFLEPLTFGIRPVIGIHWENFAWIGRWIVECGLVSEVHNVEQLAKELQLRLTQKKHSTGENRQEILAKLHHSIKPLQGGTQTTCKKIIEILKEQS